ncbi:MAG: dihydrolipoyllysine-residue acetyltransferase [gamma proteobacterium symbiont of Ctena orbiculata]|uniref:Acetyltransferase component of pyruvate dehydrogenase complex n=1 Tax=Candidatus Thiodiazotropha taylori TaxID=2792791 RepID=A0A944QTN8_9GAMM|nr:dihydrolipoyllysine-residue acetyltransferase [Candidatus Thiodiazotropha taylori]PUB86654.1 MAG: dihydrolipoyllysine-residue acetyltransferase [gamma proteobacterium symbiont of Ctena orbiculata]MBT2987841.1 dihydrolipoyllysine-residue acetyltransferase [Candidatus Thiodiazotropha taylori]MBT2995772.1 dihydrolipoyllysine-residue acetyltransferase [Candidatus Thiodiazotropha taylori]MBT2999087.1 dihydrolipoyllysine-residue acetyltransferase [Candidatus Thiodiazotropha taylori]
MGKTTDVLIPDIGDFESVEIIEILVSEGDQVTVEESLLTLESDKATMEIPSPYAGEVKSLLVKVGDRVGEGDKILTIEAVTSGENKVSGKNTAPPPAAEEVETVQAPAPAPSDAPSPVSEQTRLPGEKEARVPPVPEGLVGGNEAKPHASPSVRRFARELGVDLSLVKGSGQKNRILKEDVQDFVKRTLRQGEGGATRAPFEMPMGPEVDYSRFGDVETAPLNRIKKISGAHLHRCWLTVPHVTQFDEADITDLEAFRKAQKESASKQEIRLTLMPFLMKAAAAALQQMPIFNAALSADGESLIYRKYVHIGVAVDTPNGLVVPVLRDVDKKGVFELASELMEISEKARAGKLAPAEMRGGCFSISSLGGIGGTAFTPIVNAPEVAILGVSRSSMQPVWDGTAFQPRLMLPLSLSYDHRVIDGADGVRFTSHLSSLLADIRCLLL